MILIKLIINKENRIIKMSRCTGRTRIAIYMPTHEEDCWWSQETDETPVRIDASTYAERLIRWEIFRDLKYHVIKEGRVRNDDFNPFHILRPPPNHLLANENVYEWCDENWGTRIELSDGDGWVDGNTIVFEGIIEWPPPIVLIEYLCDEIGFYVEALHFSEENDCWGSTINGITEMNGLEIACIDEEDPEDEEALKIHKLEQELGREFNWDDLTNYCLMRDIDDDQYQFRGLLIDGIYILNNVEFRVDELMDSFIIWKEKYGKEISSGFNDAKHRILDKLDNLQESGKISEGRYLLVCNKLKIVKFTELDYFKGLEQPEWWTQKERSSWGNKL